MRALVVPVLLFAACGSSATATFDGFNPPAQDLGVKEAGDASCGAPIPKAGSVTLLSYSFTLNGMTTAGTLDGAGFVPQVEGPSCTTATFGACVVTTCAATTMKCGQGTGTAPNAGSISVTGGQMMLTLSPLSNGQYQQYTGSSPLWNGGEKLSVSAVGGDVPAFRASLVAPSPLTITSPVSANPIAIDRSADFSVKWSGSSAGYVQVGLTPTPQSGQPRASITCLFPAAWASGAVPAAALGMLPSGSGQLGLVVVDQSQVMAGDWPVSVSASTYPVQMNGAPFIGGPASFQ